MISIEIAQEVHKTIITTFGGSPGIRDFNALESALARPFQSFGHTELYPDIFEKASALIESIVANHPFVDGNKRTGYVITRLFLIQNAYDISASEEEKYQFVISIASGKISHTEITAWLKLHCTYQNIR